MNEEKQKILDKIKNTEKLIESMGENVENFIKNIAGWTLEKQRIKNLIDEQRGYKRTAEKATTKLKSRLRQLNIDLKSFEEQENNVELVEKLLDIRAKTTGGYLVEFLKIDAGLTVDDIAKRFKLLGRPKQYKTIYAVLDDLIMKETVKRLDPYKYDLTR